MSRMKYLYQIAQEPQRIWELKTALKRAEANNLNYAIVDSEVVTLEQLKAMIHIVEKHVSDVKELKRKQEQLKASTSTQDDQVHNE